MRVKELRELLSNAPDEAVVIVVRRDGADYMAQSAGAVKVTGVGPYKWEFRIREWPDDHKDLVADLIKKKR